MILDDKYGQAGKRLQELETEADGIIDRYLQQVRANPDARELKEMQQRFAGVRKEQFGLFDEISRKPGLVR